MQNIVLSAKTLARAAQLTEERDRIQEEINSLLAGNVDFVRPGNGRGRGRGPKSPEARKKIAAGQRKRWARYHEEQQRMIAATQPTPVPAAPVPAAPVPTAKRSHRKKNNHVAVHEVAPAEVASTPAA